MKFLIITQVVDTEHPILGFFHRWIEEFSSRCEQVIVICLQEGKHDLPDNVTIYSLGKEKDKGRVSYLFNFYKLIWSLRDEYDNVFVHMNQIYIILGAPIWRLLGKNIGLWYAHGAVTLSLRIAIILSHQVFTSTKQGMRVDTKKRVVVGQGIDIERFKVDDKKIKNSQLELITVGRLSQSKNIDTLLRASALLKEKGINFTFNIIGLATTTTEESYALEMKKRSIELGLEKNVNWVGSVTQDKLPMFLQQADIFIHDGSTDSLDKALLEAVLCGCVVVSSNPSYSGLTNYLAPSLLFKPKSVSGLADITKKVAILSEEKKKEIMQSIYDFVRTKYSVANLISGIVVKY